ncbi:hypothetical protein DL93DRAFT_304328 [Clavulina sp. PMI_390]|nr:hypothetical protein DL93DRAFT_304328 [Clavulina sp. PMI_390]
MRIYPLHFHKNIPHTPELKGPSVENQLQKDVHILYVCQKWRVIALSCPELWTTIYTSDSIPKLQRALRLSSNLPLNIVFSHPAPPLREFESGLGSMQDIVNQIQTRSISKLIINYAETDPAPILRDAFGRGSVLSVLLAKSVHISSLTPRRAADVRGVRFPCHEVFSIWAWRFPILDVGQFCGSRLSIQTVETTPEFFARFLHGFSHLESIDIDHFVVIGGALHWQPEPITFSSLRSLSFANTKALDTARTLDLVNTNGISALRLDSVLAFDYDDEDQSEGTLMANGLTLYEYFDQPCNRPSNH